MARRRIRATADRAWAYSVSNIEFEFTSGNQHITQPLIAFDDIELDEARLVRETSEFYFERLLIWWQPYFFRDSLLASGGPMCMHRLGVLNDSVDIGPGEAPGAGANFFDRVLQEHCEFNVQYREVVFDGSAISVSTEATATQTGYPVPPRNYLWDLSSKFALREDTSLVWQISSSTDMGGEFDTHHFGVDLVMKALLRRRSR